LKIVQIFKKKSNLEIFQKSRRKKKTKERKKEKIPDGPRPS
jgi:hypothetical protein